MSVEPRDYSTEEITTALARLARNTGRIRETARELSIPESTLRGWKNDIYVEQYRRIERRWQEEVEGTIVQREFELALEAIEHGRELVVASKELLEAGEVRDPAKAAANMAKVADSAIQKGLTLSGRPSVITGTADLTEALKALIRSGFAEVVDADGHPIELPAGGENGA